MAASLQTLEDRPLFCAVLLAGGQGKRLGYRDKATLILKGKPLLAHSLDQLRPQTDYLAISRNEDMPPSLQGLSSRYRLLADCVSSRPGPLAGVAAGLSWLKDLRAQGHTSLEWLLTASVDSPFLPQDFGIQCLKHAQSQDSKLVMAESQGRFHPTHALWHYSLQADVQQCLEAVKTAKAPSLMSLMRQLSVEILSYGTEQPDPFLNINRPEDIPEALKRLTQRPAYNAKERQAGG